MAGSSEKAKPKPVMYVVLGVAVVAAAVVWFVFGRDPGPGVVDAGEPAPAAEETAAPAPVVDNDPAPANARTPPAR